MIRYVVLFEFKADAPQEEIERWLEQARALPDRIDFIRERRCAGISPSVACADMILW